MKVTATLSTTVALFLLVFFTMPGMAQEKASATGSVMPADLIRAGLANHPDRGMAMARIKAAEAMLARARSAFYPSLGLYTEAVTGDAPSAYLFKRIDQRQLPPNTNFNDPGHFDNIESGARLRLNLYNGGRDRLALDIARSDLVLTRLDQRGIENSLTAAIIAAYFDALTARAMIATARQSVTTVQSRLKVMRVRHAGGGALKSDLLSLEVRLAQARESVLVGRNAFATALAALEQLTDLSVPADRLPDDAAVALPPSPQLVEDAVRLALARRPEMNAAEERLAKAENQIRRARSGYLPTLDLTSRWYVDDEDMHYNSERDNWTAGVMASWEVFDGFATRNEVRRVEHLAAEARAARKKTVMGIRFDVKRAYLNRSAAAERVRVTRSAVADAEESLDLVRQQYDGGSATITRYLEAELDLSRARSAAARARFDLEKAKADIGRAMGLWQAGPAPKSPAAVPPTKEPQNENG
jgi:outer membrane protein